MTPVARVLVVGGGIGGMSAAIALRRLDIAVEVIDLDPEWRVYGAGITITGPTLRAFRMLGIYDAVMAEAYGGNGIRVCAVDGSLIRDLDTPKPIDSDVPGSGGVMRPVLHRILSQRTLASGTTVRLGITLESFRQDAEGVHVRFSNGDEGTYDLVIGADGLFSRTRKLLMPQAPEPEYVGQYIWRVTVPRLPDINRRHYFLGGPVKCGLNPVSQTEMYMFVLQSLPHKQKFKDSSLPGQLKGLIAGYGGAIGIVREQLGPDTQVIARPLEAFLLPGPWHSGRVVLIGDAAHPTTPQLASGAGMAIEDALVLADEIRQADSLPAALGAMAVRRYERCRLVVENSLEIGRRERAGAPVEAQTELVERSLKVLAQPI